MTLERLSDAVASALLKHAEGRWQASRIWVAPRIPAEKLEQARSGYANLDYAKGEQPLVLIATKRFNDATTGFLFTDMCMHYRILGFDKPLWGHVTYDSISSIRHDELAGCLVISSRHGNLQLADEPEPIWSHSRSETRVWVHDLLSKVVVATRHIASVEEHAPSSHANADPVDKADSSPIAMTAVRAEWYLDWWRMFWLGLPVIALIKLGSDGAMVKAGRDRPAHPEILMLGYLIVLVWCGVRKKAIAPAAESSGSQEKQIDLDKSSP